MSSYKIYFSQGLLVQKLIKVGCRRSSFAETLSSINLFLESYIQKLFGLHF